MSSLRSDEEASQKKLGADPPVSRVVAKNEIELQDAHSQGTDSDGEATTGGLAGIERVEGAAKVWTKPWLIVAYCL